jgi:hypothetical protein
MAVLLTLEQIILVDLNAEAGASGRRQTDRPVLSDFGIVCPSGNRGNDLSDRGGLALGGID